MAGPTPSNLSSEEWIETRAKHLTEAYGLDLEECRNNALKQEATQRRFREHEEVVLWFEHDLFCQINLIYLLDWFSKQSLAKTRLSLICIDEFPGVEDFRGLGQLTGAQLASLFDKRQRVTDSELTVARQAWAAYRSSDPRDILRFLDGDTSSMPFLRDALRLHLARFPSVFNGLGRIENRALKLISRGAIEFKSLFPEFEQADPVYGLGDSQFWNELKRIAECNEPLITISDHASEMQNDYAAALELTGKGREVLCGERDFVELNGIDLWLGGIHLSDESHWRWDEVNTRLTFHCS